MAFQSDLLQRVSINTKFQTTLTNFRDDKEDIPYINICLSVGCSVRS